jgi:hypothetical protein
MTITLEDSLYFNALPSILSHPILGKCFVFDPARQLWERARKHTVTAAMKFYWDDVSHLWMQNPGYEEK